MANSALRHDRHASAAGPKRLLLLLATQNADKTAQPAAFEERLGMMCVFGAELHANLAVGVDVGVTTEPYFHNKAAAIEESAFYGAPPGPEQVHLTGFDTLVRFLDTKYYPPQHTLAPLAPFLSRHRLRVTYRTGASWGDREEQARCLADLREGRREHEGGKREWADRVDMVEGRKEGEEVISSTRVRDAVRAGHLEVLPSLVTDGVREWIVGQKLYTED